MEHRRKFEKGAPTTVVCELLKALNGLKQASWTFCANTDSLFVSTLRIHQNLADECMYIRQDHCTILIIALYMVSRRLWQDFSATRYIKLIIIFINLLSKCAPLQGFSYWLIKLKTRHESLQNKIATMSEILAFPVQIKAICITWYNGTNGVTRT